MVVVVVVMVAVMVVVMVALKKRMRSGVGHQRNGVGWMLCEGADVHQPANSSFAAMETRPKATSFDVTRLMFLCS